MGGKVGDGDLHSTREGQTQSPQNGTVLSTIGKEEASGRLDKQTDGGKRGVGMRGWICSSALVPAGRLHAHAVPPAQRATAGARHEAARNGSDQSASDSLAMTFAGARQGMDWTGGGAPLAAAVTRELGLVGPPQRTLESGLSAQRPFDAGAAAAAPNLGSCLSASPPT